MRRVHVTDALALLSRYNRRPMILPRFPPAEGLSLVCLGAAAADTIMVVEQPEDLLPFFRRLPDLPEVLFFTVPTVVVAKAAAGA